MVWFVSIRDWTTVSFIAKSMSKDICASVFTLAVIRSPLTDWPKPNPTTRIRFWNAERLNILLWRIF
tara:strand:- start:7621 stop:7821 length:201 start_codon:yes stop_codon:yes gene_type:complete